jgi:adenine-specific DNA-methyltransferase
MLHDLLGRRDAFPFPKSVYAVEDCLAAVVRDRPDAVIVDVFAGSGTTAHATMLLNAEDGGRRTSILVSNNELGPSDEKRLRAAGQQPGSVRWEASGIFRSVTRPRIEAVVKGRSASGEALTGRHVGGRPYAEGFEENVDFFELGLLDPYSVEIGRHFSDVYPLLWMSAGHHGALESPSGDKPWVIAGDQRLGVLLDDLQLTGFSAAVEADPRITSTWIVTDSESRFEAAQRELSVPVSMLYRSYLESFVLNTRIR